MYVDEQVSYNKKGYVWSVNQTVPLFFWKHLIQLLLIRCLILSYLTISNIISKIIITNNINIKVNRIFSLLIYFILYLLYIKIRPKSPDNNRRKHLNSNVSGYIITCRGLCPQPKLKEFKLNLEFFFTTNHFSNVC